MSSKILNGKIIANKIIERIKKKIKIEISNSNRKPKLSVIWIGNNASSKIYIQKKKLACIQAGIEYQEYNFKQNTEEKKILNLIQEMNQNKTIDGILVQLPLPKNININKIITSIHPKKDVDGFHPYNIGCLCIKSPKLRPCTSRGVITLLKEYNIKMHGLNALIIGASNIVGRPMNLELLLAGCTTTVAHRFTKNLNEYIKKSDLIVIAIGKPNFLKGKDIKLGAIIIDVGINKIKIKNQIVGDVEFESTVLKASYITPVPGGVGPMTVATLLKNTLEAYQNKYQYPI
ncbi:bifunctional methylenetetrahydrofolate dehydrogenase/methenyltetrahydrofolate cyclohydrolase FolD [Buchnera aphidicola]|uniref:bifunctional methylenetetrahydrofolate dehydrogenase/methenyltetrahydrofolate cyclohydrolase FolD n=1 Tax=Buchnera aphidicola TaxID=9 RepID=UPI00346441AB